MNENYHWTKSFNFIQQHSVREFLRVKNERREENDIMTRVENSSWKCAFIYFYWTNTNLWLAISNIYASKLKLSVEIFLSSWISSLILNFFPFVHLHSRELQKSFYAVLFIVTMRKWDEKSTDLHSIRNDLFYSLLQKSLTFWICFWNESHGSVEFKFLEKEQHKSRTKNILGKK